MSSHEDVAIRQLENAGLIIDGALEYGEIIRVKVGGDKGSKKSGWYFAHEFELDGGEKVVVGRYGDWKRYGEESLPIEYDLPPLSDEQKAKFAERHRELREKAAQEKLERARDAAERAERIFSKLPDTGGSAYLQRKKVRAFGLKFSRGSVVIPVRNAAGELVGLQFIAADGDKKFLTGTPKRGCFHMIGASEHYADDAPIAIGEGYATCATIHQATSWMVAVAFDAGNLLPVAQALRAKYPERKFILCADNDAQTEGNPGVSKATEAARAIGAQLCIPDFSSVQARVAA